MLYRVVYRLRAKLIYFHLIQNNEKSLTDGEGCRGDAHAIYNSHEPQFFLYIYTNQSLNLLLMIQKLSHTKALREISILLFVWLR